MNMAITANEIYVVEGGARIRTRCPKEQVTDDMVAWAAKHQGLDVGDSIRVQCMDHYRQVVIWQRDYLIAARKDYLNTVQNERGDTRHVEAFDVRIVPSSDWWEVTMIEKAKADTAPPPTEDTGLTVKWNLGKKTHEVLDHAGNVVASFSKDEGGKQAAQEFADRKKAA